MRFDHGNLQLHKDFTVWHYDLSYGFAVEIATDKVRRLLPPGLHPFEVKPQVSLLLINVMRFMEGNHNFDRPLTEVTFSVNVIPDLFLAGRMPKFACYVLNVGVSDLAFAQDLYNTDVLPFYPQALEVEIDEAARRVSARDADGPIFTLENVAPALDFARKEDFYQVFVAHEGQLLHGAMTMNAETYEHQVARAAGRVHAHPIFKGLEVETARADSYMQNLTGPDAVGLQHYYRLRQLT